MNKEDIGVYRIVNTQNSKCYVGSTKRIPQRKSDHFRQLRQHVHPNKHLQAAWHQSGESAFVFEILERCPEDQLLLREQYWIDALGPEYNQRKVAEFTPKSRLGMKNTAEHNQKIAQSHMGMKATDAAKEKMRIAKLGTTDSEETRQKKSEKLRGRPVSKKNRQSLAARSKAMWAGRTPEERQAIAQKRSPEVLEAQAERFRQLGKDPARIEASKAGTAKRKAERQAERKAERYAFTKTPEYAEKMREARARAAAEGKSHGGPKPDPTKPRSRHRAKQQETKETN